MDSADSDQVQRALLTQEALLERHEKMLHHINKGLSVHLRVPRPLLHPPNPPTAWLEAPGRTMPSPEPFTGELEKCLGFLAQVSLFFRQQNKTYASDNARIAFFVQLLRDRVLQWAQALLKTLPNISYPKFLSEFKGVFEKDGGPSEETEQADPEGQLYSRMPSGPTGGGE
uniref:DUF4939 domain-containing protein n=1 Tax=Neolamprologus brichardi TaxID=32507 RepID=A0A3Q4MT82_NEOBR